VTFWHNCVESKKMLKNALQILDQQQAEQEE
jgi:hypothetical protein